MPMQIVLGVEAVYYGIVQVENFSYRAIGDRSRWRIIHLL